MSSNTFLGNFYRISFPEKSRIVKDNDSTGAKLFNSLGSFVEENFRSKIFNKNIGPYLNSNISLNNIATLHKLTLTDNQEYKSKVLGNRINKIKVDDVEISRSFEEFYESGLNYHFKDSKSYKHVITTLENESFLNNSFELPNYNYIYLDVKKVTKVDKDANEIFVTIRGKDSLERYVEEKVMIKAESLYQTKNKFKTIESFSRDINKGLNGGAAISINGLLEYEIDVLIEPAQRFHTTEDGYERKRILIPNHLSKILNPKIFLENSVSDNLLYVELYKNAVGWSYLKYIHRYFTSIQDYKGEDNKELDDDIFEEVLVEVLLLDEENEPIRNIVDWEHDITNNKLIFSDEFGEVYSYPLGMKETRSNSIQRTLETKISIDAVQDYVVPEDNFIIRLITSNLDFPIKKFFVGKLEDGSYLFLQADKTTWNNEIHLFDALNNQNLQDTLDIFNISYTMGFNDIELFTVCFEPNQNNMNKIDTFNLLTDDDKNNKFINECFNKLKDTFVNSKIISASTITPTESSLLFQGEGAVIKNIYIKNNSRDLFLVDTNNNHHKYLLDDNKYYFYNHCIYTTKLQTGSINLTFELNSGEAVEVTLNV